MATFPMLAPTSISIRVGTEYKSPYQWAAVFAPNEQLVQYKDAMLWLEGEEFETKEEFLDKVKRVLEFQEKEKLVSVATVPSPTIVPKEEAGKEKSTGSSSQSDWTTVSTAAPKPKKVFVRWSRDQLAAEIVSSCIAVFKRVFSFTGPSLRISEVYPQFKKDEFTYPQLIGAIRDQLQNFKSPSVAGFPVASSARYWAETSAGKGKNFNFKVQRRDKSKPNGWSAVAQVHVLWE